VHPWMTYATTANGNMQILNSFFVIDRFITNLTIMKIRLKNDRSHYLVFNSSSTNLTIASAKISLGKAFLSTKVEARNECVLFIGKATAQ